MWLQSPQSQLLCKSDPANTWSRRTIGRQFVHPCYLWGGTGGGAEEGPDVSFCLVWIFHNNNHSCTTFRWSSIAEWLNLNKDACKLKASGSPVPGQWLPPATLQGREEDSAPNLLPGRSSWESSLPGLSTAMWHTTLTVQTIQAQGPLGAQVLHKTPQFSLFLKCHVVPVSFTGSSGLSIHCPVHAPCLRLLLFSLSRAQIRAISPDSLGFSCSLSTSFPESGPSFWWRGTMLTVHFFLRWLTLSSLDSGGPPSSPKGHSPRLPSSILTTQGWAFLETLPWSGSFLQEIWHPSAVILCKSWPHEGFFFVTFYYEIISEL